MMCFMFFQFDFICICVCVSLSVCMFVRPNNNLVHNFIQSVQKNFLKTHQGFVGWFIPEDLGRVQVGHLAPHTGPQKRLISECWVTMLRLKQNSMFP